jgi:hypothetical protein
MTSHKYIPVGNSIMLSENKISVVIIFSFSLLLLSDTIAGMITASNLYAESHERSFELSQKVFGLEKETMNIDLVINTTTLEFQDLNNNSWPDVGETSLVLGKLYTPNTLDELGTYRASFVWGNWANSTEGAPISLGTQVFDIRDNGTIVVVGDIVTDARDGNATAVPIPIAAAIAGGTGGFKGVSGTTIITERFYEPGTSLFLDVVLDIIRYTT